MLKIKMNTMSIPTLKDHPRLWISKDAIHHFSKTKKTQGLKTCKKLLKSEAQSYLNNTQFDYREGTHNSHLIRARIMQKRLLSLTTIWLDSGDPIYRIAIMKHIQEINDWEYWSWITWRKKESNPNAIFDLSYGENSTTIAIVFDLLYKTLSKDEKKLFIELAVNRSFKPFLRHCSNKKDRAWWFENGASNWNSVCAGGAGILALAMMEHCKEAKKVLILVEKSIISYFDWLKLNGGGWDEGIGYWAYGMMYGFRYLLSWENSLGKKHPIMEMPTTKKTIHFPLDFYPNGTPAGFGDSNSFKVHGFHYQLAKRFRSNDITARLDEIFKTYQEKDLLNNDWPVLAELLLFHPESSKNYKTKTGGIKIKYKKMNWCVLADQSPKSKIYLSIRGGSTETPHAHPDLLSFNYIQGKSSLIQNVPNTMYLDTTFGHRRYEIFEISPPSKNAMMVNGVGIERPAEVEAKSIKIGKYPGYQIDGVKAMGTMRDGPSTKRYKRTFLLIENQYILIVDKVQLAHTGLIESRLHSSCKVSKINDTFKITDKDETCELISKCSQTVIHKIEDDSTTDPKSSSKCLRMITQDLVNEALLVSLIIPIKNKKNKISLRVNNDHKSIEIINHKVINHKSIKLKF